MAKLELGGVVKNLLSVDKLSPKFLKQSGTIIFVELLLPK